jgi:hypothetical protein
MIGNFTNRNRRCLTVSNIPESHAAGTPQNTVLREAAVSLPGITLRCGS